MKKLTVHWLGECKRAETFREATSYMDLAPLNISSKYLHHFLPFKCLKLSNGIMTYCCKRAMEVSLTLEFLLNNVFFYLISKTLLCDQI